MSTRGPWPTPEGIYEADKLLGVPKLPADAPARKALPIATGVIDYFPLALIAVAELSRIGNDQHNPGQPLHWARGKSMDQADCLMRHFIERGTVDGDGVCHSTKVAWRALALLQLELEGTCSRSRSLCSSYCAEVAAWNEVAALNTSKGNTP